jgi:copper chaperone CopZ
VSTRRVVAHLRIAGMPAVHAVHAVYTAFAGVPGILRADVSLGEATVEHDGTVTREALAEAVALAGCELVELTERRGGLPLL